MLSGCRFDLEGDGRGDSKEPAEPTEPTGETGVEVVGEKEADIRRERGGNREEEVGEVVGLALKTAAMLGGEVRTVG